MNLEHSNQQSIAADSISLYNEAFREYQAARRLSRNFASFAEADPLRIIVRFDALLGWSWSPFEDCGYSVVISEHLARRLVFVLKRCKEHRDLTLYLP